ncbi:MAG: TIGR02530 family flagellar biosynthesis protein [Lachnospiraceae bacterium]
MDFVQSSFVSMDQAAFSYLNHTKKDAKSKDTTNNQVVSFQEVLQKKKDVANNQSDLVFSKHANERLLSRNINLNEEQMVRLNQGVLKAREKSINESLVMMDNIAFIVNVKNNTVVTAMDQETNDNNVFTNIDGAVIV